MIQVTLFKSIKITVKLLGPLCISKNSLDISVFGHIYWTFVNINIRVIII